MTQYHFMNNFSRSPRYNVLKPDHEPKRILIHGLRFILTSSESERLSVVPDQSLLIEDGEITEQFPKKELDKRVDLKTIDLIYDAEQKGGIVATPGFINLHSHPPMYLLRSTLTLAEDNLEEALRGMAKLEAKMNTEDFYLGALGDFTEQQKSGITTTLSHYGVFDPIERAASESGQQVINCLSAASNSHPENTPALVEKYLKKKNTVTTPGIALHYVWKATPPTLKKIAALIKKYNAYFTVHVAESEQTVERCLEAYGERPVAVLAKYDLLGPRTIISHAVHLTPEEISIIKKTGTIVVHLPTSNLLHRSGQFKYTEFSRQQAKQLITLGTDSVISKNRLDLLSEALAMKTLHQAKEIISYEELFNVLTAQPAKLLGLKKLGQIKPGFTANLCFWKLKDRGLLPYDEDHPETLVSNLITHGSRGVRDLMIKGRFVISNRYHNLVDESGLLEKLQTAHMELRKR